MNRTITAQLNQYRQSPRKVRQVANLVRGKRIEQALAQLEMIEKRAAEPIKKLIQSAVANAKNLPLSLGDLVVKRLSVDAGPILYRRRFRARGRATPIRKRTSRVLVILEEKPVVVKK